MIVSTFQLILCTISMLLKLRNADIINPIGDIWLDLPSGADPGTVVESIAIDTDNQRVFAADGAGAVRVLEFTLTPTTSIQETTPISIQDAFTTAGNPTFIIGDVTSVAYSSAKGWVAACVVPESHATTPGWLAFIDTTNLADPVFKLLEMPSCYLPDHVSWTSDGNTLIVACEGEPDNNKISNPQYNPEGVV
eukprot:39058_1